MSATYKDSFARWFDMKGIKYADVRNVLWREYNKMVVPVGPVSETFHLSNDDAKTLLQHFPKAIMCRWTKPTHCNSSNNTFYAVICQKFIPYEKMPSKQRGEILKGLNHCIAQRIEPAYLLHHGYDVYCKALKRFKKLPISQELFSREFKFGNEFEDIVHYWGVFHGEKLVAYAKVLTYGKEEANVTVAKFDPEYLKFYSSYALFYRISEYYLQESGFHYVNDGFRSLHHVTNIQELLIRKFGYEYFFVDLSLYYRKPWDTLIKISAPFEGILKRIQPAVSALYEMNRIIKYQQDKT